MPILKKYKVVMKTEPNGVEFGLLLRALNDTQAIHMAKGISQGCQIVKYKECTNDRKERAW